MILLLAATMAVLILAGGVALAAYYVGTPGDDTHSAAPTDPTNWLAGAATT